MRWLAICRFPDTKRWSNTTPPAIGSGAQIRGRFGGLEDGKPVFLIDDLTYLPKTSTRGSPRKSSDTPTSTPTKLFGRKKRARTEADGMGEGPSTPSPTKRARAEPDGEGEGPSSPSPSKRPRRNAARPPSIPRDASPSIANVSSTQSSATATEGNDGSVEPPVVPSAKKRGKQPAA